MPLMPRQSVVRSQGVLVHVPGGGYSKRMTTETTQREAARSPQAAEQIASFRRDPPLHTSFPVTLPNGAVVTGFNAQCGTCGETVDPAMVHGRLFLSLPTVQTIDANAYCVACQRLIHVDARFRAVDDTYQFEYPNEHGQWRLQGRQVV